MSTPDQNRAIVERIVRLLDDDGPTLRYLLAHLPHEDSGPVLAALAEIEAAERSAYHERVERSAWASADYFG